jgi:hypothetical protein
MNYKWKKYIFVAAIFIVSYWAINYEPKKIDVPPPSSWDMEHVDMECLKLALDKEPQASKAYKDYYIHWCAHPEEMRQDVYGVD